MESSKQSSHLNFWANILLYTGFLSLLLFGFLIYQRYNPQKLNFEVKEISAAENSSIFSAKPIGIKINSINLLLPIDETEIKNNKWQASTNAISYLKTSPIPGEKGNSILYGHNWPNLLGNLQEVKPGDKITIIYSNNTSKDFEIEYLTKVSPSDTEILKNSDDNRITLYTCTGFLDTQRLVVVAKLLNP